MNYLINKNYTPENTYPVYYANSFLADTPISELLERNEEDDFTKEEHLSHFIMLNHYIKYLTELKEALKDTVFQYAGTGEKIDGFTVEIQKRNDIQYKECPLYVSETAKAKERENQLKELIKTATTQQTTVVDPVTGEYLDAVTEVPNNVLVVKKGTK